MGMKKGHFTRELTDFQAARLEAINAVVEHNKSGTSFTIETHRENWEAVRNIMNGDSGSVIDESELSEVEKERELEMDARVDEEHQLSDEIAASEDGSDD